MGAAPKLTWRVEGMDCASCVAKVTRAVERLPGVSGVEVNLMAERLTLQLGVDGGTGYCDAMDRDGKLKATLK